MRLAGRALTITLFFLGHALRWWVGWLVLLVAFRPRARRQEWFGDTVLSLFRGLGATFIKVGQIMSTRPDLFPPHVIRALEKLQDQVGPFAYEAVSATFVEDFGRLPEEVFDSFDKEPIASASVAQVHRARKDGRALAVKVRRPGLPQIVELDLAYMRGVGRLLALSPLRSADGTVSLTRRYRWVKSEDVVVDGKRINCRVIDFEDPNKKWRRWRPSRSSGAGSGCSSISPSRPRTTAGSAKPSGGIRT